MNYIKEFQKNNSLVSDGIIGKKTLLKMKEVFNLPSDEATAHFIGQIDHETGGFKFDRENLNYSSKALRKVFKKYFPTTELANEYARQPEKIANKVYADRMGNGPESSGDGWSYKGRGSLQLTGKNNYIAFSRAMNKPHIVSSPNSILPEDYWKVAIFFFQKNKLFNLTKVVDYNFIRKLTKRINGGYNGLQHRYDTTMKYYNILKKKVETEQDEKQDNRSDNDNPGDNNQDILVPEDISREGSISSSTGNKKESNSGGFIGKIIGWVLFLFKKE